MPEPETTTVQVTPNKMVEITVDHNPGFPGGKAVACQFYKLIDQNEWEKANRVLYHRDEAIPLSEIMVEHGMLDSSHTAPMLKKRPFRIKTTTTTRMVVTPKQQKQGPGLSHLDVVFESLREHVGDDQTLRNVWDEVLRVFIFPKEAPALHNKFVEAGFVEALA